MINKISEKVFDRNYYYLHSLALSKKYASIASKKLNAIVPDLIFAPAASAEVAFLQTQIPIWAAELATKDYGVDEKKIRVIPYGANIDEAPPRDQILHKKKKEHCKLLFLGVSWQRKGRDLVLSTLKELNALGLEAELLVCGCRPPKGVFHPKMKVVPFLNKSIPSDLRRFDELLWFARVEMLMMRG